MIPAKFDYVRPGSVRGIDELTGVTDTGERWAARWRTAIRQVIFPPSS
jgi:hypothetical protein